VHAVEVAVNINAEPARWGEAGETESFTDVHVWSMSKAVPRKNASLHPR